MTMSRHRAGGGRRTVAMLAHFGVCLWLGPAWAVRYQAPPRTEDSAKSVLSGCVHFGQGMHPQTRTVPQVRPIPCPSVPASPKESGS